MLVDIIKAKITSKITMLPGRTKEKKKLGWDLYPWEGAGKEEEIH